MPTTESLVQGHYGSGQVLARVLAALKAAGTNPEKFDYQDLFNFDQLHGRGIAATRDHAERAKLRKGMEVLDLGCGVGGASRYLAAAIGCRVTGIDLTQQFIDTAIELTRRCGLSGIEFRQANALKLPFADGSFDHVWCHNVTMNIPDKATFANEVARVLRPGGRFSCSELARGPRGELSYPVPWAMDSSSSFLATPAEMRAFLERAGLRIVDEVDLTGPSLEFIAELRRRAQSGVPAGPTIDVVMGQDMAVRRGNSAKGMTSGALLEHFFIAEKG